MPLASIPLLKRLYISLITQTGDILDNKLKHKSYSYRTESSHVYKLAEVCFFFLLSTTVQQINNYNDHKKTGKKTKGSWPHFKNRLATIIVCATLVIITNFMY